MIINSGSVEMESTRAYSKYTLYKSASSIGRVSLESAEMEAETNQHKAQWGNNADITISSESQQMLERLREKRAEELQKQQQMKTSSEESLKMQLIRKLIEALKSAKGGEKEYLKSRLRMIDVKAAGTASVAGFKISGSGNNANAGKLMKTTVISSFKAETEQTAFESEGIVKTSDGREIRFNVSVEMSRSFLEKSEVFTRMEEVALCDPLVINLSGNVADVSDQKFFFDLDANGEEEEISYLEKGSGFLALDNNDDGVINDGSELFGTKSGDGFLDLALHDEDGNGWIDEADSVFSKLKVWTKNEDGTNQLMDLKEAGVGALYLGNADTKFHLNSEKTNETNGMIQKTGVFLMENGSAGTLQHVDLAI